MDSKKIIEQNKNVYDRIASLFAQTRKYLWDDLKPLKKYMRHGYRVLDIGCGTGRLYHLFKDFQGIEYTGLDQSEKQIAEAKKDFPQNTYVVAEMTDLPFNDCSFDIIYCIAAFHHLPDEKYRLKALHEMKRVSKSGHYIIMTNWNLYSKSAQKNVGSGKWEVGSGTGDFLVPWLDAGGKVLGKRYYHGFTLDELAKLFKKAKLEVEEQYYTKKGRRGGVDDPGNMVSILKK